MNQRVLSVSMILVLLASGFSAKAAGILNTPSSGYLICVNSKTKVVTHPGTSTCAKGTKKLTLGAQGAQGLTGAAGLNGVNGKDGRDGKDGKTLWNGVKDPENTWGAPGDMFINSVTKTLFGPKNLDGTWPAGVSLVGPKGDQGPIGLTGPMGPQGPGGSGPAGPAGATGPSGSSAPITSGSNCIGSKCTYKIGETGPGNGVIFFVDYHDQYSEFDYLEVAPLACDSNMHWATTFISVPNAKGWTARSVGSGKTNTEAILLTYPSATSLDNAAKFASGCSSGSKSDWFLGSFGEMALLYQNNLGLGDLDDNQTYWTSSIDRYNEILQYNFYYGRLSSTATTQSENGARSIRSF